MSIGFSQIPGNMLVPFVSAEFDASQASQGPALLSYRALLIGQRITGQGSATANSIYQVTSADDVIGLAGRGSMLHRQAIAWFASNRVTELWVGVLEDAPAGVAATGTITVTGPATAPGTVALYLGGVRVPVGVSTDDTAADIAAAIVAEIAARPDLPVTAAVGGPGSEHVVTVTFRHKGEVGNSYDMRDSYADGEALPAGVGLSYVAMSGGTTNPDLSALIAALGDQWFHIWSHPYIDATSLAAIEAELADRFGPMRSIDGVAISSAAGSFATLSTLGSDRNSPHSVILAQPGINPLTPPMEHAAEAAALIALHGAADPARPFQALELRHSLPPEEGDLFTLEERDLLLHDGVATTRVAAGGVCQLERVVTTYKTNPAGAPDPAYRDVTTLLTLMYLRFSWRVRMQTRYPRHKLADDGTRFGPGQVVMTPKLGRAEALSWFREMERLGLVEGFERFKADLAVERNAADPNRLDVLLPPDLINQLIQQAARISFRL